MPVLHSLTNAQDLSALCCTYKMSFKRSLEVSSPFVNSVVTVSMQKCHIICEEYHASWLSTACAYHSITVSYVTVREDCPALTVSWQQQMNVLTAVFGHGTTTALGPWAAVAWEVRTPAAHHPLPAVPDCMLFSPNPACTSGVLHRTQRCSTETPVHAEPG